MEDKASASPCRYVALDIHKYYSVVAGVVTGMTILAAIGDTPAPTAGAVSPASRHQKPWRVIQGWCQGWSRAG